MNKPVKTNVMRLLDRAKIPYDPHEYDVADGRLDGEAVADKIGRPREGVYKTLVTRGKEIHVFVIPVESHLDLKKAAAVSGEKKLEMLPQKELKAMTGYVHGGCSPVGMKKAYSTFFDRHAQERETICVSAGQVGVQVEVEPNRLAQWLEAPFADLITEEPQAK